MLAAANGPAGLGNEHRSIQRRGFLRDDYVSRRRMMRRANGRHPMENVRVESRAVERLIRFHEVKRLSGLSGATLYRKMSAREFPRPVELGAAARAWVLSEVQEWIVERIAL